MSIACKINAQLQALYFLYEWVQENKKYGSRLQWLL